MSATLAQSEISGEVIPPRDEQQWYALLIADLAGGIRSAIAAGLHLEQAKAQLGQHGGWLALLHRLGLSEQKVQRYMRVARGLAGLSDEELARMPGAITTLDVLARPGPQALRKQISGGRVNPDMSRADAEALIGARTAAATAASHAKPPAGPESAGDGQRGASTDGQRAAAVRDAAGLGVPATGDQAVHSGAASSVDRGDAPQEVPAACPPQPAARPDVAAAGPVQAAAVPHAELDALMGAAGILPDKRAALLARLGPDSFAAVLRQVTDAIQAQQRDDTLDMLAALGRVMDIAEWDTRRQDRELLQIRIRPTRQVVGQLLAQVAGDLAGPTASGTGDLLHAIELTAASASLSNEQLQVLLKSKPPEWAEENTKALNSLSARLYALSLPE